MTALRSLTEVEVLRRRVVEMEGKDEELIRMADQCRDLDHRLANETSHSRSLKLEVDKLNGRISELDRLEDALCKSKQDCSILKSKLEREREFSKVMSGELDTLRLRVRELETIELQLEKSEMAVRQDLGKLRSLTVALVEDRKNMAERLQQAEEKIIKKDSKRNEQSNLATMTERLREEKQLALRSKADLEEKIKAIMKEKGELQDRLRAEEERNRELQSKITIMKKKLNIFDNRKEKEDKYTNNSIPDNTAYHCQTEDNKVKELTKELDELQKKLHEKELLQAELMKLEEDYESLERKLKDEQRRSQILTEELEVAKKELSRYKQEEKQEVNQEHRLLCHLQKEQVKSRLLTKEVDTLKEKLQKLMGTEESISNVQMDQSTLQRKLTQQEAKNKELVKVMEKLTSELDMYRQTQNNNFSHHHQTTREVQTEPANHMPPNYNQCSEKLNRENTNNPNLNTKVIHEGSLNILNTEINDICQHDNHSEIDMHQNVNGEVMTLTHTPGQPLQIKVTPHHMLNTATLEITSPSRDSATSYTSTAAIPTRGASPKQRITIIQNSGSPAVSPKTSTSTPECTISPFNETPVSRVLSPKPSRSTTPENNSPIQIVTVKTCSPEPAEDTNQVLFCKTPDQPNSWQHQRSNSNDTSPSIITAEDSKIHIHLGSLYSHPLNGMTHSIPQSVGPYYLRHEQRTHLIANGCHVKGVGKITSSITISPANASASQSNITVGGLCD
ncbi:filamin A-interacting protein 1-like [Austrofundulus limnaeus]|uniref:Filamin A-interacting protein 1-like n=1 Tax=Austrofundulus limnaeus TaxID=52670 RepID=A0A2I4D196_AUSLI|nr:PREDICTED: filamin A-interacting protein 1-like [Austrofundulus limnaeus]